MSRKQNVISLLWQRCQARGDAVFDNNEVKQVCHQLGFSNPFDATKFDNSALLPPEFRAGAGRYVVHLGKGKHRFVPGLTTGYHNFERIEPGEKRRWPYRRSLLNEFDTSESNILSVGYNQRILHDFLYGDIVANPMIYMSRRTSFTGAYTLSGQPIAVNRLQMEIDMVLERDGDLVILEGKNRFPPNFAVYQLFHPHLYYTDLKEQKALGLGKIQCCYILRNRRTLRMYLYRFHGREKASIELLKKAEYELHSRDSS